MTKKLTIAFALAATMALPVAASAQGYGQQQWAPQGHGQQWAPQGNPCAPVCAPPRPVCRPVCQPVCQPVCDPCRRSGLFGLGILGIL